MHAPTPVAPPSNAASAQAPGAPPVPSPETLVGNVVVAATPVAPDDAAPTLVPALVLAPSSRAAISRVASAAAAAAAAAVLLSPAERLAACLAAANADVWYPNECAPGLYPTCFPFSDRQFYSSRAALIADARARVNLGGNVCSACSFTCRGELAAHIANCHATNVGDNPDDGATARCMLCAELCPRPANYDPTSTLPLHAHCDRGARPKRSMIDNINVLTAWAPGMGYAAPGVTRTVAQAGALAKRRREADVKRGAGVAAVGAIARVLNAPGAVRRPAAKKVAKSPAVKKVAKSPAVKKVAKSPTAKKTGTKRAAPAGPKKAAKPPAAKRPRPPATKETREAVAIQEADAKAAKRAAATPVAVAAAIAAAVVSDSGDDSGTGSFTGSSDEAGSGGEGVRLGGAKAPGADSDSPLSDSD